MEYKKIVVVTGGNRGIGKEICRQLAEQNFSVVLTARDYEKAKAAAKEIVKNIHPFRLDISDINSIKEFESFITNIYGKIDILINNAGIMGANAMIDFDIEEMRTVIETNFFSTIQLTQHLLPLLKRSSNAKIINISSEMGLIKDFTGGYAAYRLSKLMLNGFTALLAKELKGTSIKINAMCPGWCRTDMGGSAAPRSAAKGAETAVWLATTEGLPSGKFFKDMKMIDW